MNSITSWDTYFIKMALLIAQKSKDPSTQVGCVIVGPDNEIRSTGFNGFPRGVQETLRGEVHWPIDTTYDLLTRRELYLCDCGELVDSTLPPGELEHFQPNPDTLYLARWERPQKYEYVEHAERNAVYNAARIGVSLLGCRAYLNWEPRPCVDCCKAFIQAGIIEVIGPNIPFPSGGTRKDWKFETSTVMMEETGVGCREVDWNVPTENTT
jgi:dCMP deaminase